MKKILTLIVLLTAIGTTMAQDIRIIQFERKPTWIYAQMDTVADNNGKACALICFDVRDTSINIEPNLGVLKKEVLPGEIRLYVPAGTDRLTIRGEGMLPLRGYKIPVEIESKATYHAIIECGVGPILPPDGGKSINFGGGYQFKNISGLFMTMGVNFNHHVIELGGLMGLNKTDRYYFYNKESGMLMNSWEYKAWKGQISYGYEIGLGDYVSVVPFGGLTATRFNGNADNSSSNDYKNAFSTAGLTGVRLWAKVHRHFYISLTAGYEFNISKSNNCKLISSQVSDFKKWTDGPSIGIGLMVISF